MTKFKITNNDHRARAFNTAGGYAKVEPGKTETIDVKGGLSDTFIAAQALKGVKITQTGGGEKAAKASEPADTYTVTDKGSGWYVVTDKDGKEVTKSMHENAVKGFADMDADKQAAFVQANAVAE
ncbi:hypothetical protein [Pararhizobium mangrovi]|uniref:Uncharacterized protein n=1 Tax=Pararhizobium mangrovi TaxID=2590452 RepID=A0A506TXV5_9HYPH|nr:hypothetical protein [Pararhizobium mangrovi]TPW26028.1 hypothetical protein FJU11_16575 [Pararhizobium mangrovi]